MKQVAIGENHLYAKTYAKGKKFVGKCVVVYVLKDYKAALFARAYSRPGDGMRRMNRVGVTVTKKIGGAVTRSRVKRIIREAYRLTEKERSVRHGMLVVIVARDRATSAKTQDIRRDLDSAFKKLDMLPQPAPAVKAPLEAVGKTPPEAAGKAQASGIRTADATGENGERR
ncbi:MAG: ribonuclease P protein component [Eubacteriales bacterium]